ncbi:MAG TPA: helix-turn-helix domain-containing protein [Candidatus Acidoferrum sp.]|nr:helix-turn-helix domain-containing protein [Candidatus Acidoferrum sp.]
MPRVVFAIFPETEILDLAGPLQVLHEANALGADYRIVYAAPSPEIATQQGLSLARLEPLPAVEKDDLVLVPGTAFFRRSARTTPELTDGAAWLRTAHERGATIGSICVGAFLLGNAGLLDGRTCTTHWSRVAELQSRFPAADVVANRLYVIDDRIVSSAGIASGIDLTLALVERAHGAQFAAAVAREMVVYVRREGTSAQQSVYVQHRDHIEPSVHTVQDWLVNHASEPHDLDDLATVAGISRRHLTRMFRRATGIGVKEYTTKLRLEQARLFLRDPQLTVDAVAERCGFADGRQLRRLWKTTFGTSPSASRADVHAT